MKRASRELELMSEEAWELYSDSDTVEIFEEDREDGEEQLYTVIDCKVNRFEHLNDDEVREWFNDWLKEYEELEEG